MLSPKFFAAITAFSFLIYYIISSVFLYFSRREFKALHGCQPAQRRYPLKDPIFGLDLVIDTIKNAKKHRHLEGTWLRYENTGTTFTSRLPGCQTVFTIDPENVKTVLATKFQDYILSTIRTEAMIPIFGHGIFTTDGQLWKRSRELLRPTFAHENLANLTSIEEHMQELLKCIPTMGHTVDLQELFFRLTMDTSTAFLFGHSVNSQTVMRDAPDTEEAKADLEFVKEYNITQFEASHNVRLGPLNKLRYSPRANRAKDAVNKWVYQYLDQLLADREAEKQTTARMSNEELEKRPYVFARELAKLTDDRQVLRDQVLNVLLAGRDTTASLLSNLFFMLAKHKDVFYKLREEVVSTLGDEIPSYDGLKSMKYLKACINESLRLHPVVPANTREATRDTFLPRGGGQDGDAPLFVAKGTQVLYSVFSMHRRKDLFGEDSLDFRPERWAEINPRWVSRHNRFLFEQLLI
jgi:cytochrome P450